MTMKALALRLFEGEGRPLSEVIEEKEQRVRVFGEAQLRRGTVCEQRQRDPVTLPGKRLGEHAEELLRSLPTVRRNVDDVHGSRSILEDDHIRRCTIDDVDSCARASEREDAECRGCEYAEPEREPTREREALTNGEGSSARPHTRLCPMPERSPEPQRAQYCGYDEQPEVTRLTEGQRVELSIHPRRFRAAALPACCPSF
jgi:hypothetical protein